ncbi:hypothetical protein ACH47B_13080 [Rhodococcus sp. NPDC019627]|uniref:hypothetical protein n=1 Tax=unclassified Rhodococcus (in: high G+C Gram-positive bacteria) TaxID=192944 RepID=UPI0033C046E0
MSAIVDQAQYKVDQAKLALEAARTDLERALELDINPDRGLAEAIRDAYYDDGLLRVLGDSRSPEQWLRMAKAARDHLAPKREPRVFKAGDPEPVDRDGLILEGRIIQESFFGVGNHVGEKARIQYLTSYGRTRRTPRAEWWQVNDSEGERTYAAWSYWLEEFGPFTEVMEEPREPRKFTNEDQEPTDVKFLRDYEGDLFRYVGPDHWEYKRDSGEWSEMRFRWREVTSETGSTEDLEYTE